MFDTDFGESPYHCQSLLHGGPVGIRPMALLMAISPSMNRAWRKNATRISSRGKPRLVPTRDHARLRPDAVGRQHLDCRPVLMVEGTLLYTLSFGTDGIPRTMLPISDRVANSFTFDPST
jgi:hypothetical protein